MQRQYKEFFPSGRSEKKFPVFPRAHMKAIVLLRFPTSILFSFCSICCSPTLSSLSPTFLSSPFCERTIEGHSVSWWTRAESTNHIEEVSQGKGFGHILVDQPAGERETGSSQEVWFSHCSTVLESSVC